MRNQVTCICSQKVSLTSAHAVLRVLPHPSLHASSYFSLFQFIEFFKYSFPEIAPYALEENLYSAALWVGCTLDIC